MKNLKMDKIACKHCCSKCPGVMSQPYRKLSGSSSVTVRAVK
jgi:hypothetical protein